MKLHWPSELTFRFICDNKLVSNLLVYVVFLSRLKNNFTIGPLITNENGEIIIAQDFVVETIEKAKVEFPMDYSGTLYDCYGIEVIVETTDDLITRIDRGREFYPEKANELQELMQKCENWKYNGEHLIYKQPINFELVEVKVRKNELR